MFIQNRLKNERTPDSPKNEITVPISKDGLVHYCSIHDVQHMDVFADSIKMNEAQ